MEIEEVIRISCAQGNSMGQVSLAQYVIKQYGDELSPDLKQFLEKVSQDAYEKIGESAGTPPEDVALSVSQILENYNH